MSIEAMKDQWGDYAKDIRLNIGTVLTTDGAPDLTASQIFGIALASAYATRSPAVIEAVKAEAGEALPEAERAAAKAAATVMAMNNVYYRFAHLVSDKDYAKLPAKLRMNIIGAPGIAKADFELYSLAVSAINGCGMCMDAHVNEVTKAGITKIGVQSTIRIASVVNAAAQAEAIKAL
jgi:alkyl hydroperoxide reductase subunit D